MYSMLLNALGDFPPKKIHYRDQKLTRAEKPLTTAVTGKTIQLDGLVKGLQKDQILIVSGKLNADDEDTVSEVVLVESATPKQKTGYSACARMRVNASAAPSTARTSKMGGEVVLPVSAALRG